jgi:hypothetical protein
MRRDAKQDENHKEIRTAARAMGAGWLDTFQLKNACDAMMVYRGQTVAIEIKDGQKPPSKQKLSEGEKIFRDHWTGRSGHYAIITSVAELMALMETLK